MKKTNGAEQQDILLDRIRWEKAEIAGMEKRKAQQLSYLYYYLHPILRESKRYIPQTGAVLLDEERYYPALRQVDEIDKACTILDICIQDAQVWLQRHRNELDTLKMTMLQEKVEAVVAHHHAEQYFALPRQKGMPIQISLEF